MTQPTGSRVYTELTREQLSIQASHQESSYFVADQLTELIERGLNGDLRNRLAEAGVHGIGVEFEVDATVGFPPFPDLTGIIGIGVVFFTTTILRSHIYAFAVRDSDGNPEAIRSAPPDSNGSVEMTGTFFAAHYTGPTGEIGIDRWKESTSVAAIDAVGHSRVLLGAEFIGYYEDSYYEDTTSALLYRIFRDVRPWIGFGTDLSAMIDGDDLTVNYSYGRYRNFEWLLGELDILRVGGTLEPSIHPFVRSIRQRLPDWTPDGNIDGSFTIPAPATRIDAYGLSPLWYEMPNSSGRQDDIKRLQADLWTLGFWFKQMVDPSEHGNYDFSLGGQKTLTTAHASGKFNKETAWAVREFQVYASMATVARTREVSGAYADTLEPVTNTDRYTGEINGVVDYRTAELLQFWLANDWRCPVVVEARSGANHETVNAQNFWVRDAHTDTSDRMFVRDLSGYYTIPGNRLELKTTTEGGRVVLGDYISSGPRSKPPSHVWPEGELIPEYLIGVPRNQLNMDAELRSTYKVVRSVAERECRGFFDSINSYDSAVVSVGPCHWTYRLGGLDDPVNVGELPGYVSYLKDSDHDAFDVAVGDFGVDVDTDWRGDGNDLFPAGDGGQRKYEGRLRMKYANGNGAVSFKRVAGRDRDFFRTWHWFYRFVMAGRTNQGYQQRMWHMARLRIRDIREAQWPARVNVPNVTTNTGTRSARIGDVFNSELATALLVRWHIFRPGHICAGGRAGESTVTAYRTAVANARRNQSVNLTQDPSQWQANADYGQIIVNGIIDQVPSNTLNTTGVTPVPARNGRLWDGNGWAVYEENNRRWEWRGAATDAPLSAPKKRGLLLGLTALLNWPAGASRKATNHIGGNLYTTLGGLDEVHESFDLDYDGLPNEPYSDAVFGP